MTDVLGVGGLSARDASCHEAPARRGLVAGGPQVALVGSPNSGKSTLFNALTGAGRAVGNYPGTSVEVGTGRWLHPLCGELALTDLPGAYSLAPISPDEALTEQLLRSGSVACVVIVCDAAHLSRSLVLVGHVRQLPVRVIVALTMTDVARRRGVSIDRAELARRLDVPVVALDPRRRADLDQLVGAVAQALGGPPAQPLPWVAPPQPACCGKCPADCTSCQAVDVTGASEASPEPDDLAAEQALYDWVNRTADAVIVRAGTASRTWTDRVDRWVTAPILGPAIFLAVMWLVFSATTRMAAPLQDAVDTLLVAPASNAATAAFDAVGMGQGLLAGFVVTGLIAGVGMLLTFVPLMTIMFALLALLEDSGYLARAAVVTDRMMGRLGLPGRAFLPLVVGFGCNVPAISAVRVLPDARHRLLTALLVPFTSCSARLTVYVMVAATFFPDHSGTVVFAMYLLSIVLVVIGGLLLRRTLIRTMGEDPLIIDLPPYQMPHVRVLGSSTWLRVRGFLQTASGIIVATVSVVWLLGEVPAPGVAVGVNGVAIQDSLYAWLAEQASVIFAPAGFAEWHAVGALMVGFVAKEAVISSWAQTYAADTPTDLHSPGGLGQAVWADFASSSGGHPQAAALAFLAFLLAYTPCVATLAAQRRQIGWRWTLCGVGMQFAMAWLLAVALFQSIVALS